MDFVPDADGVESIAKEIKLTGRSYPLFQIALLVLERPARYTIRLRVQKKPGGEVPQRLFACKLDGTAWLNEDQAVRHTLGEHFDEFYETRKTETEGPKGNFTFVAQCGVTDEYLGAPNHHDYQNRLVSFHAERLARMPFEKFKSRIRIVKEEEAINAWLEQAKWKTEYVTRKAEAEQAFAKRDEVEAHFREQHLNDAVEEVEVCEISGENAKTMANPRTLAEFLKDQWHKQKHFPMQLSTHLSKQFSRMGLQFFKKDKKVTHVSVARPNFLDVETEPVSEGVKKIMQFIDGTEECTRRQILEHLGGMEHVEPKESEEPVPAGTGSSLSFGSTCSMPPRCSRIWRRVHSSVPSMNCMIFFTPSLTGSVSTSRKLGRATETCVTFLSFLKNCSPIRENCLLKCVDNCIGKCFCLCH